MASRGKKSSPNKTAKYKTQFARTTANKQRNIARQIRFELKHKSKKVNTIG